MPNARAELRAPRPFVTDLARSTKSQNPPPYSANPSSELLPLKSLQKDRRPANRIEPSREIRGGKSTTRLAESSRSNPVRQNTPSKTRIPELNLVTNFSRGPSKRYGQGKASYAPPKSHGKDQETIDKKTNGSSKGLVGSLRRADSKASDLSPSDRTLVIGMDMPPELKEILDKINLGVPNEPTKEKNPKTPDIVVTPAGNGSLWPSVQGEGISKRRHRAPSSLYSQMTVMPRPSISPWVPSTPQVPTSHLGATQETSKATSKARPHSRVTSWGTVFDEDELSDASDSRPRSRESQTAIMRGSTDSSATSRRSKGWWNEVLSPFLSKSFTSATKRSPDDAEPKSPALPQIQCTKYITQSPEHTRSGRSGSWTDMSRWETPRTVFEEDRTRGKPKAPGLENQLSPEYRDIGGLGAAAEYFEASWHDENSPTLFFKCQNHDCSACKSRALDTATAPSAHLIQNARGISERRGIKTHSTSPSEATEIDDEEAIEEPARDLKSGAKLAPSHMAKQAAQIKMPIPPPIPGKSRALAYQSPESRSKKAMAFDTSPIPSVLPPYSSPEKAPTKETSYLPAHPRSNLQRTEYLGLNTVESSNFVPARKVPPLPWQTKDDPLPLPPTPNAYQLHQHSATQNLFPQFKHVPPLFPPPPSQYVKPDEKMSRERKEASRETSVDRAPRIEIFQVESKSKRTKLSRRKKIYWGICLGLLGVVVLIITLVLTLTVKRSDMPVQSSWVNITGFPPIPTGIATIARPEASMERTACVQPSTMWSCALPKEQQSSNTGSDPNQPNMRVEIRFQNGTSSSNRTSKRSVSIGGNAISAGQFVRDSILRIRDSFTDNLYTPNPAPPSQEDQAFMGNTTDGNSEPFAGESTPFFMSFLSSTSSHSTATNLKRQSDAFPNITNAIPPPSLSPDGTAAPANLFPYPAAQPLRLYDRGKSSEHYGFYTYYDRSIFLKSTVILNGSQGPVPDDFNGGSLESAASLRCTWAQTRFLVQIWTNVANTSTLLTTANSSAAANDSANDYTRPGSFPYPVTVTLDRHGGDAASKMIYCYGVDEREHIVLDAKAVQLEDRGVAGQLVNPTTGVFGNANVTLADGGPGGVDGGSGGCGCQWRNWQDVH